MEPEPISRIVPQSLAGCRLDQALAELCRPHYSRGQVQRWIRGGRVRLCGQAVDQTRKVVHAGEAVYMQPAPEPALPGFQPESIPIEVLYEDEVLLVVHKPAGLVTHPGAGRTSHTLLNALLHHDMSLQAVPRAGIIHRLDKDTSGLLLVAKTRGAHACLVESLRRRVIGRAYLALVVGRPQPTQGCIELPIGRHPVHRTRMAALAPSRLGRPGVRAARTHYRVRESLGAHSLLEVNLYTGRTHQIRVHMATLGHPVVGDRTYGGRRARALVPAGRQMLHAHRLCFSHPLDGREMRVEVPPPADMQSLLGTLRDMATQRRAS